VDRDFAFLEEWHSLTSWMRNPPFGSGVTSLVLVNLKKWPEGVPLHTFPLQIVHVPSARLRLRPVPSSTFLSAMPPAKEPRNTKNRRKPPLALGGGNPKPVGTRSRSETVWVSSELERRTKGAGGRRGLAESPTGYYLALADIFLGSTPSESASPTVPIIEDPRSHAQPEESFSEPTAIPEPDETSLDPPLAARKRPRVAPHFSKPAKLAFPKRQSALPKPAARPKPPKAAFLKPPKPLAQPKPPKGPKPPTLQPPKPPRLARRKRRR
jgi:hypothetical protein